MRKEDAWHVRDVGSIAVVAAKPEDEVLVPVRFECGLEHADAFVVDSLTGPQDCD